MVNSQVEPVHILERWRRWTASTGHCWRQLQADATQSYAALGQAVGLSAGSAHERVRKLRERGVIRRTTIDVDPAAVGRGVLAFVMLQANAWMGDPPTRDALAAIPEIQEAHVIAGSASLLVKIRTSTTESSCRPCCGASSTSTGSPAPRPSSCSRRSSNVRWTSTDGRTPTKPAR